MSLFRAPARPQCDKSPSTDANIAKCAPQNSPAFAPSTAPASSRPNHRKRGCTQSTTDLFRFQDVLPLGFELTLQNFPDQIWIRLPLAQLNHISLERIQRRNLA